MGIWAIIGNLGNIVALIKAAKALVELVIATKAPPGPKDAVPLLDALEKIFKSHAINIKGVDDDAIAKALGMIRDQLEPLPVPAPAGA